MTIDYFELAFASFCDEPEAQKTAIRKGLPSYEDAISYIQHDLNSDEAAFRRGYQHALAFVMDQLNGNLREQDASFLNRHADMIYKWRFNTPLTNTDPPPGHFGG